MKIVNKILCVLAVFATSAVSTSAVAKTWSVHVEYDSATPGLFRTEYYYFTGEQVSSSVSGVGAGGGAAVVVDTANGEIACAATGTAGYGQPFSSSDSASGRQYGLKSVITNAGTGSSGAYVTCTVIATW